VLLVFHGPSCSGKSTVAGIIAQRTGASVWTGSDYLRLAKSEPSAWLQFMTVLERAAAAAVFDSDSVIFVHTGSLPHGRFLPDGPAVRTLRFTAAQEVLEARFAPRVGGRVSPAISAMLARSSETARRTPADEEYDTSVRSAEAIAEELMSSLRQ
jgi:predicted kinase